MAQALYPPIEPYMTGTLKVDDIHTIYYEQCGKEDGKPIVFIHGGPGAGTGPDDRRYSYLLSFSYYYYQHHDICLTLLLLHCMKNLFLGNIDSLTLVYIALYFSINVDLESQLLMPIFAIIRLGILSKILKSFVNILGLINGMYLVVRGVALFLWLMLKRTQIE